MRKKAEQDIKGKSIIALMKCDGVSRGVIISDDELVLNKLRSNCCPSDVTLTSSEDPSSQGRSTSDTFPPP